MTCASSSVTGIVPSLSAFYPAVFLHFYSLSVSFSTLPFSSYLYVNISLSCALNSLCHSLHVPCRRAVEELLKETSRARVRAETMGPAGW